MSCANVQSVANICAPRRFTNVGTHRALPRSIDITPLTQATVPSMKHNHFISRAAAFSAMQPRSKSNGTADVFIKRYYLQIHYSFQFCMFVILVLKASQILYYHESSYRILTNYFSLISPFISLFKNHHYHLLQKIQIHREFYFDSYS